MEFFNRDRRGRHYTSGVQATKFEFERRFWIICAFYFTGFSLSLFDHVGFITWLRGLFGIPGNSAQAVTFARTVIVIGAALVFVAAALRTWGAAYLRTSIVHDTSQHSEAVVADGPFRYTRNPLYLASLLMAIGIGMLASRTGFAFLVLANWIFVYRLIFREEEALLGSQGDRYRSYYKSVPRFWPALRTRLAPSTRSPQWAQALAGETFIWLYGVAVLAIAITLNARLGLLLFAAGFLAHFTITRWIQRRG